MKPSFPSIRSILLGIFFFSEVIDAASVVEFASASKEGNELEDWITITVTCTPPMPPDVELTVVVKRSGGTADKDDITRSTLWWNDGMLFQFHPGNTESSASLGFVDDGLPEPDETIELSIVEVLGPAVVGANAKTTVTVHNGSPRFVLRPSWQSEGRPYAFEVIRQGDTNESVTVDFATVDGSAIEGRDYEARSGSLEFLPGQTTKSISGATIDNGQVEVMERVFGLRLTNPSPGATFRGAAETVGMILDDEVSAMQDRSFGQDGFVQASGFALRSDGKIFVVSSLPDALEQWQVSRLNSDGARDSAFTPAFVTGGQSAPVLSADHQGRVLVSGDFASVNGIERPGLARLQSDGSLDSTFAPAAAAAVGWLQIAVLPSGQILCGGRLRLNSDGSVDPSFATPEFDIERFINLPDGKLLVVVSPDWGGWTLRRLSADGILDPEFHQAAFDDAVRDIKLQSDGKILVVGWFSSVDGHPRYGLARLNSDGAVDGSFNPAASGYPSAIGVGSDGEVLVATIVDIRTSLMERFAPDGSPGAVTPIVKPAISIAPADFGIGGPFLGFGIGRIETLADGKWLLGGWAVFPYECFCGISTQTRPALGRLRDDLQSSAFEFLRPQFDVNESAGTASVTVRRVGNTARPATVGFRTADGTAVQGDDYVATAGTLEFMPLETVKTFTIPLVKDDALESDEFILLSLADASEGMDFDRREAQVQVVDGFGLRGITWSEGLPTLHLFGHPGSTYLIDAVPELSQWRDLETALIRPVATVALVGRERSVTDLGATNWPTASFYQVRRGYPEP